MEKGLVSFVISAYNAEETIGHCIKSIQDQSFENWEAILINDCSTDNTHNLINHFLENDCRIKLIDNKENIGLTKSLNIGINHTRGEFVARLDADDIAMPTRIEKQVQFLDSYQDIALVGTGVNLIDSSNLKIGRLEVLSNDYFIQKFMTKLNLFSHSTLLIRKKVLEEVGNYREKFRYSQDYDLLLRISDQYKMSNIPEPLQMWRVSEGCITMRHRLLQRAYADIARDFAIERCKYNYDSYESTNFSDKINQTIEKYKGNYLCDTGVLNILLNKKYKIGTIELLKGIVKGGLPSNSFNRALTQVISKIE